jgi:hypothetical protein
MHIHIHTSLDFVYLLNNLNNMRVPNPIPKILLLCDGFGVGFLKSDGLLKMEAVLPETILSN